MILVVENIGEASVYKVDCEQGESDVELSFSLQDPRFCHIQVGLFVG